ncbi:putative hydroxymethylpyrimidine transporter CytX [Bacillota bacterium LX-D]|nr:putative hydroxymethylpyrimidine transporter CytX [Bacillota bacterium LX-D]
MPKERTMGGFSLFALWFGAAVSLAEIMTGSLIAPLGTVKGMVAILLGHLIGCLILGIVGIIGFRERKPSLIASRTALGKYGSFIVSIFNIIQLLGWTGIMLIQCARSVQLITTDLFGLNNLAIIIVFVGILVGLWALSMDKGIHIINNIAVMLLAVLSCIMLGLVVQGGQVKPILESISFGTALELSIIMPLSWVPLISDYTMAAKSAKGSFVGAFIGYFLGSSLMYCIGLIAAIYAGTSDPISMLAQLNLGYIALFIVIFATVTTTFLDVYSGVWSTLNLAPKLPRKFLIGIYLILGILLAIFFPLEQYENFLYMIGSLFAPVFAVIIVDYFIFKQDRSATAFNIPGLLAAIFGISTYYIVIRFDLPLGSTVPTMLATSILYFVMRYSANTKRWGENDYVK